MDYLTPGYIQKIGDEPAEPCFKYKEHRHELHPACLRPPRLRPSLAAIHCHGW